MHKGLVCAIAVSVLSIVTMTFIPIGSATTLPTLTIFSSFSYSEKNPTSQHPTQFWTNGPINATGFNPGEQIKIDYFFPNAQCIDKRTADSTGKVYANRLSCTQGSAGYTGNGAHEGTNYTVTATGQTSGLTATTKFVPTLTDGSTWNLGPLCTNQCTTPQVSKSLLHLAYSNPLENSSYNKIINNHNAINNFQKINGTDFATSFSLNVLNKYHGTNVTRIISEYNDSGHTNGIVQGINSGYWVEYNNERYNADLSTPCYEIGMNPTSLPCPNPTPINASAVGNYTNDASLRVKNAGKHFLWAGEISAVLASYKNVNWTRIDHVVLQLQGKTYSNDNPTVFNSTISQISDFVRTKNPNTLIFVQVNPGGYNSPCKCNMSTLIYDLQYSRFHASTPTKPLYDGVSIFINLTSPPNMDKFITYLGR